MLAKIGFDNEFLHFFAAFITIRKQIIFLRNTLSLSRNITSGSPQGSIYAVFLFSLYINDMPDIFDNPLFLYADDTTIIGNWFDLSSCQTDLSKIIIWAAENRIDFNFNKFEEIRFQKSFYPLNDTP